MLVYDNFSSKKFGSSVVLNEKDDEQKYAIPKYSVYEIDYTKGYNKGDAYFVNIEPGRYILKLKSERTSEDPASYVVNYCSNSNIKMREVILSKKDTAEIMRQAMVSIIGKSPRATLDKKLQKD